MDYSVFDSLLDSVFIINKEREIVYCNQAAATLTGTSVRRLTKRKPIYNFIQFDNETLFTMPNGEWGKEMSTAFTEVDYKADAKGGKIQICIQPAQDDLWTVVLHDVTLEERLHSKYHLQLKAKENVIKELELAKVELENYSKNLEKMVEERTAELNKANLSLKAIMDSLGQGFLIFNEQGLCGDIYTKACESVLEIIPKDRNIIDVLKIVDSERAQYEMWVQAIFAEALPFDSLKELGPDEFYHSQGNFITLDFYPIRDENNKIINVVLVATDKTLEHEAKIAMEKEKQHSKMVLKLIKNKKQFKDFLDQCIIRIKHVVSETKVGHLSFNKDDIFRMLHTIEGEAGIFGAEDIRQASRTPQELLNKMDHEPENAKADIFKQFLSSVEILQKTYENFLTKNEETFNTIGVTKTEKIIEAKYDDALEFLTKLNNSSISSDTKEQFKDIFLKESAQSVLSIYNELTASIAAKQDKIITPIKFTGDDLRVDTSYFKPVSSTLVHAFRNIIDHGIETPETRENSNKPIQATIEVHFEKLDNGFNMTISDDGAGIDPEKIRAKLLEKCPELKNNNNLNDDSWVIQQIFNPGFSSRDEVSEFSGRGVGMDAIKTAVESLGGTIHANSKIGIGTDIHIFVPSQTDLSPFAKSA
ncbi:MAG: PAS domain-containing protein [Bdellovibrionaceae bacterium]|jgi:two-component system, chemotaxis family, sensor kinase CheA|nr:PAS domain-containing protein [Pseudobdellovibrionaceae bacterium]